MPQKINLFRYAILLVLPCSLQSMDHSTQLDEVQKTLAKNLTVSKPLSRKLSECVDKNDARKLTAILKDEKMVNHFEYACSLRSAIELGKVSCVKVFLEQPYAVHIVQQASMPKDLVAFAQENKKEKTAALLKGFIDRHQKLVMCSKTDDLETFNTLLHEGVSPHYVSKQGNTALGIAVYYNKAEFVKILLKRNDALELLAQNNKCLGDTPLAGAKKKKHKEISGIIKKFVQQKLWGALKAQDCGETIKALEAGAIPERITHNVMPLLWAIETHCDLEILEALLSASNLENLGELKDPESQEALETYTKRVYPAAYVLIRNFLLCAAVINDDVEGVDEHLSEGAEVAFTFQGLDYSMRTSLLDLMLRHNSTQVLRYFEKSQQANIMDMLRAQEESLCLNVQY